MPSQLDDLHPVQREAHGLLVDQQRFYDASRCADEADIAMDLMAALDIAAPAAMEVGEVLGNWVETVEERPRSLSLAMLSAFALGVRLARKGLV